MNWHIALLPICTYASKNCTTHSYTRPNFSFAILNFLSRSLFLSLIFQLNTLITITSQRSYLHPQNWMGKRGRWQQAITSQSLRASFTFAAPQEYIKLDRTSANPFLLVLSTSNYVFSFSFFDNQLCILFFIYLFFTFFILSFVYSNINPSCPFITVESC